MKYDKAFFDQSFDRHNTACVKWDAMEAQYGAGINPMWVADMDFVCPGEITEAMVKRAAHPAYGYTFQTEKATQAMLDFMKRRHHVELTSQIIYAHITVIETKKFCDTVSNSFISSCY